MGEELTAALFTELELRGAGPGAFMRRTSPDIVAGRGLGDIAALVAAGVIDHEHAVELAGLREQLIARADADADAGGGLLAVLDIDADAAARCVAALSGARIARHDAPACVVLAGNHEQLADARAVAGDLCIAVAEVDAPAALHSPAMAAAADRFAAVLERFGFHDPAVPVYSSARPAWRWNCAMPHSPRTRGTAG